MRTCLAILMIVALPVWGQVLPNAPTGPVLLSVHGSKASYFVGENMLVTVRVLVDSSLGRDSLRQLFRRRLALPVDITLSEVSTEKGWAQVKVPRDSVSLVLNGEVAMAVAMGTEKQDSVLFRVYELQFRRPAVQPGTLSLGRGSLRGERVLSFRDDFFDGRVPDKTEPFVSLTDDQVLTVVALPEEGRPASFRGAMGVAEIGLEVRHVASGSVGLRRVDFWVEIGADNGEFGKAPAAGAFPGFEIVDQQEETDGRRRTWTLDLLDESQTATAIGPLDFCSFDPNEHGTYLLWRTKKIEVSWRDPGVGVGAGVGAGVGESGDETSVSWMQVSDVSGSGVDASSPNWWTFLVLISPWIFFAGWHGARLTRGRLQDLSRIRGLKVRHLRLLSQLRSESPAKLSSFREYMALLLMCDVPAVTSARLWEALLAAGFDEDIARRSQAMLEKLQAGEFALADPPTSQAVQVLDLVDDIEKARRGRPLGAAFDQSAIQSVKAVCLVGVFCVAASAQASWEEMSRSYFANGDLAAAEQVLLNVLPSLSRTEQGVALFNLGRCAETRGATHDAAVYFQRALLRLPDAEGIVSALRALSRDLGGEIEQPVSRSALPLLLAGILTQVALLLALLAVRRRGLHFGILALGVVLAIGSTYFFHEAVQSMQRPFGVVFTKGTPLRESPLEASLSKGMLTSGQVVRILARSDRWTEVEWQGETGWIASERVDSGS